MSTSSRYAVLATPGPEDAVGEGDEQPEVEWPRQPAYHAAQGWIEHQAGQEDRHPVDDQVIDHDLDQREQRHRNVAGNRNQYVHERCAGLLPGIGHVGRREKGPQNAGEIEIAKRFEEVEQAKQDG
jgi:hypothetical protein